MSQVNRKEHKAPGKGQGKHLLTFLPIGQRQKKFCPYNYDYEIQVAVSAWNIFYFAYKMMGNKTEITVLQKPCYYALIPRLFQHMLL